MDKVTVIIPAYNEEARIAKTITGVLERNRHHQVIIVDDGSIDQTRTIAAGFNVELISFTQNQGKAKAVEAGLAQANGDIIILLDADLGETARYYPRLVEPLLTGEAQVAVAVLDSPKGSGGIGMVRRLANWGLLFLTGKTFPPVLSGQRAFLKRDLERMLPLGDGFGLEMTLTVRAIQADLTLVGVPLPMEHAYTGRNLAGFSHRVRQFQDIWRTIWWLRRQKR